MLRTSRCTQHRRGSTPSHRLHRAAWQLGTRRHLRTPRHRRTQFPPGLSSCPSYLDPKIEAVARQWVSIGPPPAEAPEVPGLAPSASNGQVRNAAECVARYMTGLGAPEWPLPANCPGVTSQERGILRKLAEDAAGWHHWKVCSCYPVEAVPEGVQGVVGGAGAVPGHDRVRGPRGRPRLVRVADYDYGTGADCQQGILVSSCDAGNGGDHDGTTVVSCVSIDGSSSPTKVCTRCGEELPVSVFGWVTTKGRRYRCPCCRSCDAARTRERRSAGMKGKPQLLCKCGAPAQPRDTRCKECNRVRAARRRAGIIRFVSSVDGSR
jgi:hypothetical protein